MKNSEKNATTTLRSVNRLRETRKVGVVKENLASPHKAIICTIKSQNSDQWVNQVKVRPTLPGSSEGKASHKNKDERQNWDLRQYMRYLEEGIVQENQHFEVCSRKEAEFWQE